MVVRRRTFQQIGRDENAPARSPVLDGIARQAEQSAPRPANAGPLLYMQRIVGNAATRRALAQRTPDTAVAADAPAAQSAAPGGAPSSAAAHDPSALLKQLAPTMLTSQLGAIIDALNEKPVNGVVNVPTGFGDVFFGSVRLIPGEVAVPAASVPDLKRDLLDIHVHDLMELLADLRKPYVDEMNGAADDARRRQVAVNLHEVDERMLTHARRYANQRKDRWEHPRKDVQDAVLAAIQLSAVFSAESFLGKDDDAKKKSQGLFGMTSDWCGMFAAYSYKEQDLDSDLRQGWLHVKNVEEYFTYRHAVNPDRVPKWIWAKDPADGVDRWLLTKEYHTKRSSMRSWLDARAIFDGKNLDIRPGDILLLDYGDPAEVNHIAMVQSYDKATKTLFTIGGNDGGYTVDNDPRHTAPAEGSVDARKEAATGKALKRGSGHGVGIGSHDLASQPDPATVKPGKNLPKTRVYGIGRPSISDFEQHFYDPSIAKEPPTKKPKGAG